MPFRPKGDEEMNRRQLTGKVEKIVLEEVSKDLRQYCGDEFSMGPILIKDDYQPFREGAVNEPKYIAVSVVYEGDLSRAPLMWKTNVFLRVWDKMGEEGIDAYPFIDYVKKSKWQSGEWQEPKGWEW